MRIKMTLMSDACPSAGEGQAGVVDLDVPCDQYGIPYIPAKRIKGCLREAALELRDVDPEFDLDVFERLFGKPGGDEGILHLSNGYIENYEDIAKELDELLKHKAYRSYLHPQLITRYYTTVRSQTSIDPESQTAKKDTLRTIRLIKGGSVFYFNVTMENDEKCVALLEKCCQVLRRIGLNRTRGWGEVKCELVETPQVDEASRKNRLEPVVEQLAEPFSDEDECRLNCTLTLKSQLMVTNRIGSVSSSENYIPGSHILGALANEYIRRHGCSTNAHEDPVFRKLFLSNQVKFLNAYIVDEEGNRCLPLPASIVKKKDDDNTLYDLAYDEDYETVMMEEVQTEKWNGFCSSRELTDGNVKVFQVQREVEYHHQRSKDRTIGHAREGDGKFFQMDVLSPGQTFQGIILGKRKHLQQLKSLLSGRVVVRLGRSKSAQYAEAVVEMSEIQRCTRAELGIEVSHEIAEGDRVVVTLTSPMIVFDEERGVTDPDPKSFVKMLCKKYPGFVYERSFIRAAKVSGFNSRWGMAKPQVDALDAGSVIVMRYEGSETLDASVLEMDSYGLRQNEGFGRIMVQMHGHGKVFLVHPQSDSPVLVKPELTKHLLTTIQQDLILSLIRNRAVDVYRDTFMKRAKDFSTSVIYKVMTMLVQACSCQDFLSKMESKKKDAYVPFIELIKGQQSIVQVLKNDYRFVEIKDTLTKECNQWLNEANFKLTQEFVKTILQQLSWRMREPQEEEVGA